VLRVVAFCRARSWRPTRDGVLGFRPRARAAASQSDRSDPLAPSEPGAYSSYPLANQDEFRSYVQELTSILDDAFTRLIGCGFTNPETDRHFRMSVANNQGGDPLKSIGSITNPDGP
jgi:hypothetical protein